MSEVVRVNFGRPMPVFPLPETVLLPHAVQPLHIFEPRYLQMVNDCLDSSGQFAMATFEGKVDEDTYRYGSPPLRPAVCVGQIVQHDSFPDGRQQINLHGLCRATIIKLIEPDDERKYRMARLRPLEAVEQEPPKMPEVRQELQQILSGPRLSMMRNVQSVMEWFDRKEVSTHALLELIGFALVQDYEIRYRLLAEADPTARARTIKNELNGLDTMLNKALRQDHKSWPKGMSWN